MIAVIADGFVDDAGMAPLAGDNPDQISPLTNRDKAFGVLPLGVELNGDFSKISAPATSQSSQ